MSNVKQGILSKARVWAKHLRPHWKRDFWGRHRAAERDEIRDLAATEDSSVARPRSKGRRQFLIEYRCKDGGGGAFWKHKGWKRWFHRYHTAKARDQAVKDMNAKCPLWEYRAKEESEEE
jgi:hypothetical protein